MWFIQICPFYPFCADLDTLWLVGAHQTSDQTSQENFSQSSTQLTTSTMSICLSRAQSWSWSWFCCLGFSANLSWALLLLAFWSGACLLILVLCYLFASWLSTCSPTLTLFFFHVLDLIHWYPNPTIIPSTHIQYSITSIQSPLPPLDLLSFLGL